MKKRLSLLLLLLIAWFLTHIAVISYDGLHDNPVQADCILIPGNTINPDGSLSPRLKARLDQGLSLYKSGYAPFIFVSGGTGKEGQSEGAGMKAYLEKAGVPEKDILADDEGNTTKATAAHFGLLASEHHFRSVIVVSQYFHISRTKHLLKRYSSATVYSSHANYYEWRDIYSLFREFFAWYLG